MNKFKDYMLIAVMVMLVGILLFGVIYTALWASSFAVLPGNIF